MEESKYTWVLFKFQLVDTKEMIMYWELKLHDRTLRFKSFEVMMEYIKILYPDG